MLLIDIGILIAFVSFGALSWHFRVSYKTSIGAGIQLLAVVAFMLVLELQNEANFVATLAFYALVVGVGLGIAERWRVEGDGAVVDSGRGPSDETSVERMGRYFRRGLDIVRRRRSR